MQVAPEALVVFAAIVSLAPALADVPGTRVVVAPHGMDEPHASEAIQKGYTYSRLVDEHRGSACEQFRNNMFVVDVTYRADIQETGAVVTTGTDPPQLAWHPSGLYSVILCPSVAALSACRAWDVGIAIVTMMNEKGTVEFDYVCDRALASGGGPVGILVTPAGGEHVRVPFYRPAFNSVVFERERVLPDGSKNPTGVLLDIVGRVPPADAPAASVPPAPAAGAPK